MSDWYVSSVAYAAVPQWAATTAYTVGQFVRPLATPAQFYGHGVFRCTTAGTTAGTEPTWQPQDGATTTSGTAVFTCVTGRSAYGWSAAGHNLNAFTNNGFSRPVAGDRVFLSSDHSETQASPNYSFTAGGFIGVKIVSVNRAGSVPPVAADEQSGAAINASGSTVFDAAVPTYWQGVVVTYSGTAFYFNNGYTKSLYFKNCAFVFTSTSNFIVGNNSNINLTLDNTTLQFGAVGQTIGASGGYAYELTWLNTPSAIPGAIKPTTLVTSNPTTLMNFTFRGVDLSAFTGTLTGVGGFGGVKMLLDSCRIHPSLTRYATPAAGAPDSPAVELVNCFDGTNIINERYTSAGAVTTERSTTLSGGAQDDVGAYSLKLVSSTRADKAVVPLDSFWLDVENVALGASKIATVEIISSASLNNDDIQLLLEYMGTSGSPLASFGNSLASVLTTVAALSTSLATWNNSPSTPVKQLLQVTFTAQVAGRVRGLVRLGKVSATVWINPQITIT